MMKYKEAFVVDKIDYRTRVKNDSRANSFELDNFSFYEDQGLIEDFYLNSFIKKGYFELDLIELTNFLNYQFENSDSPNLFLDVLEDVVIPYLQEIIDNAFPISEDIFRGSKELQYGFVLIKDKIIHPDCQLGYFNSAAYYNKLENSLKRALEKTEKFIELNRSVESNHQKLKWSGGISHAAYIISVLVDCGYIDSPKKPDGETNYSLLSDLILNSFDFGNETPSKNSLAKYSSPNNPKYLDIDEKFQEQKFSLPHRKLV